MICENALLSCVCQTSFIRSFLIQIYFRYPTQKEWQRKEELYLKIIQYLEKGKQWEHAIPLCKELAHIYEHKVFDYTKLSSILKRQASLYEKVISSSEDTLRLDPEYFRVGFYGTGFPLFLRVSLLFVENITGIDFPYFKIQLFVWLDTEKV